MSRYWSELVNRLTPYVPGEQPRGDRLVKLNTNESPYPPSPRVAEAIASVAGEQLRRYPDPQSTALCEAIAKRNGLTPDQVFIGNGSDEVLALAFLALLKQDLPLCYPNISYSFYPVWADLADIETQPIPLTAQYTIDIDDYPAQNGGVILPNPNAPTGILLSLEAIEALLQRSQNSVVVIDEAYIDFGGLSAAALIGQYDNLLVVQTLSKSRALAGLRVGFAMGNASLIEALDRVKNSFNSYPLDAIAQAAALASLSDEAYFESVSKQVISDRESLSQGLKKLGFDVLPSAANFVFATHPKRDAQQLFSELRERGIIVRYFNKPMLDQFLRISVGTPEQCQQLLDALAELTE
ncbi:MAG: histidinol-phosphate transaminase [Halioglobus sp.]